MAEFAILVEDQFQHNGVGRALLQELVAAARSNGITRLVGTVLGENYRMLSFLRSVSYPLMLERQGAELRFCWHIAAQASDD